MSGLRLRATARPGNRPFPCCADRVAGCCVVGAKRHSPLRWHRNLKTPPLIRPNEVKCFPKISSCRRAAVAPPAAARRLRCWCCSPLASSVASGGVPCTVVLSSEHFFPAALTPRHAVSTIHAYTAQDRDELSFAPRTILQMVQSFRDGSAQTHARDAKAHAHTFAGWARGYIDATKEEGVFPVRVHRNLVARCTQQRL